MTVLYQPPERPATSPGVAGTLCRVSPRALRIAHTRLPHADGGWRRQHEARQHGVDCGGLALHSCPDRVRRISIWRMATARGSSWPSLARTSM